MKTLMPLLAIVVLLTSCSRPKVTGIRYPVGQGGYVQYMTREGVGALFTIHVTNASLFELMGALKTTYASAANPTVTIAGTDASMTNKACTLDLTDVPASHVLKRVGKELGISISVEGPAIIAGEDHSGASVVEAPRLADPPR